MGTTLKKLTSDLKNLRIDDIDGADLLLKGVKILVEYSDSPWAELIKGIFPPAPLAIGLLKAIQLKEPNFDLDTCAVMAIQQAYLDVFQTNLKEEKGALEARFDLDNVRLDKTWRQALEVSIERLMEYEIDATQIVFSKLHEEPLVTEHLEKIATNWLRMRLFKQNEEEWEAANFARRISYQLYPQLLRIVVEHSELYAALAKYLGKVELRELRELREIEKYRTYLMKLPLKPVFNETFSLKDLYVELDATDITPSSKMIDSKKIEIEEETEVEEGNTAQLMQTVLNQLEDRKHVIFIQAGPGKGKSVFCQMLAARVAETYSDWIPVFVRLRDVDVTTGYTIREIIKNYIEPHFDLTPVLLRSRRFLFILDGFDELWLSSDSAHALKFFFDRLSAFQREWAEENQGNHKIIITGRPMRIRDIESDLPSNFFRLKIRNMETPQFEVWLHNWANLFGEEQAGQFRTFLQHGKVFDSAEEENRNSLKTLASEPLLLYMLGAMYRDGALPQHVLETSRRIEIYDRAICWVCGDHKYGKPHRENKILEKIGILPDELRQLLQETALCVWQGGREFAPIARIQKRLSDVTPDRTKKLFASGLEGIHNLLASFYFQSHEGKSGNVEFSHKTFGEYLAAERIVETLKQIGQRFTDPDSNRKEYRINDIKEVANRCYSTLGAIQLTRELREFVTDIIHERLSKEVVTCIAERLYHFYIGYSDGRWADEGISRTQWDELKRYEVGVKFFEFEALVGINLIVLLCLLYRQIEERFHICGKKEDNTFDRDRFRNILALGELADAAGLVAGRVYRLLAGVSFREANLWGVILWGADLQDADMQELDAVGANFQWVDLQNADLRNADLRGANFQSANLLGADLRGANLEFRKLRHAVLNTNFEDSTVANAKILKQDLEKYKHLFSNDQIARFNIIED